MVGWGSRLASCDGLWRKEPVQHGQAREAWTWRVHKAAPGPVSCEEDGKGTRTSSASSGGSGGRCRGGAGSSSPKTISKIGSSNIGISSTSSSESTWCRTTSKPSSSSEDPGCSQCIGCAEERWSAEWTAWLGDFSGGFGEWRASSVTGKSW